MEMDIYESHIKTEYIQLNQLLKMCNLVSSGGEVKMLMAEHDFYYNGEPETRLRKKVYPGDTIQINEQILIKVFSEDNEA